jgi:hypothetical protein
MSCPLQQARLSEMSDNPKIPNKKTTPGTKEEREGGKRGEKSAPLPMSG